MRFLLTALTIAVLAVGGTVFFAHSGLLDVSATTTEPEVVRWLLQTTRENSVQRRAGRLAVPDLTSETQIAAGARAFGEMCASCHGAPGRRPVLGVKDMNPPPPDLVDAANLRTPAELFWVIKNGIRMTGMPAWSPTHTDKQLWELVAFIERLPSLSVEDYKKLAETEDGDGHGHEHGEYSLTESEAQQHGDHAH